MKKFALFLISATLFLGMIKLLQKTKDSLQIFTQREREILNDIAIGYNENEIAGLLHMSERGIQLGELNILRKTNLPDLSSAIQYALEKGFIGITYA